MAKPISWIGRLAEIRRTVENTVKTHYSRRDLEILFRVQKSAAANLMDLIQTDKLTNALLVPREALAKFLDEMAQDDSAGAGSAVIVRRREEKLATSRKRPRKLNLCDIEWVDMDALPSSIRLEPGRLEIRFGSVYELVKSLWQIAVMLQSDIDRFVARYEPRKHREPDPAVDEVKAMFQELEQMEAAHNGR